ncbi:MAG: hypothetical protein J5936_02645, partial [Acholeplasmatales bacterium]|nr:hypothetical protein [Acholeplasmatales bacterium]
KNEFKELDISEGIKNTYFLAVKDSKVEPKAEPKKKQPKPELKKKQEKPAKAKKSNKNKIVVTREEVEDDLPF